MAIVLLYVSFVTLIIIGNHCEVFGQYTADLDTHIDTWIPQLYSLYITALENGNVHLTRRFHTYNREYTLHVQKLKEVNGLKIHNLKVEERIARSDPIVYINNPVEARLPYSYLTIAQFKDHMINQIKKQKKEFAIFKEFNAANKVLINTNKKFKNMKHIIKLYSGILKHTTETGIVSTQTTSKFTLGHNKIDDAVVDDTNNVEIMPKDLLINVGKSSDVSNITKPVIKETDTQINIIINANKVSTENNTTEITTEMNTDKITTKQNNIEINTDMDTDIILVENSTKEINPELSPGKIIEINTDMDTDIILVENSTKEINPELSPGKTIEINTDMDTDIILVENSTKEINTELSTGKIITENSTIEINTYQIINENSTIEINIDNTMTENSTFEKSTIKIMTKNFTTETFNNEIFNENYTTEINTDKIITENYTTEINTDKIVTDNYTTEITTNKIMTENYTTEITTNKIMTENDTDKIKTEIAMAITEPETTIYLENSSKTEESSPESIIDETITNSTNPTTMSTETTTVTTTKTKQKRPFVFLGDS